MSTEVKRRVSAGRTVAGTARPAQTIVLYAMFLPAFVFVFIFRYIPMYGVIIAFQDFQPVHGFLGSRFVGLKWFRFVFEMPGSGQLLRNTLIIAIAKMILLQAVPIALALFLNELRNVAYKRTVQTIVYLPHFFSWAVLGGVFLDVLSVNGILNNFLNVFGISDISFLSSNTWFRPVLISTAVWKGMGWGAIIYLAAIAGINPELYESAVVDGANRWRQMFHITLPSILTTVVLLACLSLGRILNAGFEQILMLYNPVVYETADVIDTFVYRVGLIQAQFSLAAAVGLGKSVVSFVLIVTSYYLAYKFADYRIF